MKKMRKLKRLVSMMLTLAMVLIMAAPAFAATITIAGTGEDEILEGHKFVAYRIFDGTQSTDNAALGDVTWADETAGSSLLSALQQSEDEAFMKGEDDSNIFAACKTAAGVAEVLGQYADDSDVAKAFAKIAYNYKMGDGIELAAPETAVPIGYYLVVDETEIGENEDKVLNAALLQVTGQGNFEVKVKTEKPTVEKKVMEVNDTTGDTSDWQDGADYDVNDEVAFQLTGKLPNNFMEYETYYYKFTDTLSDGLTVEDGTKFTIKAMNGTTVVKDLSEKYGDYVEVNGKEITITFEDLTADSFGWDEDSLPTSIVVEYNAKLNEKAVSGKDGNINAVNLEYSNNPNGSGTGKTPDNKVIVFTYDIVANKVDGDNKPLAGAKFALYKLVGNNWVQVSEKDGAKNETDGVQNVFEFEKNDAGQYKLVETTTPAGYNTADDLVFEIRATYNETKEEGKDVSELTGLEVANVKYVDKDGNVIKEIKAEDINGTFTIESTGWSGISTNVVNNQGAVLPETGGIGTTIFYVLGTVLILGAGVLLITKKKVGSRN